MKYETLLPWIIGAIVVYLILKSASSQTAASTGGSVSTAAGVGDIGNEVGLL